MIAIYVCISDFSLLLILIALKKEDYYFISKMANHCSNSRGSLM